MAATRGGRAPARPCRIRGAAAPAQGQPSSRRAGAAFTGVLAPCPVAGERERERKRRCRAADRRPAPCRNYRLL